MVDSFSHEVQSPTWLQEGISEEPSREETLQITSSVIVGAVFTVQHTQPSHVHFWIVAFVPFDLALSLLV